jgi:hypothetical protein
VTTETAREREREREREGDDWSTWKYPGNEDKTVVSVLFLSLCKYFVLKVVFTLSNTYSRVTFVDYQPLSYTIFINTLDSIPALENRILTGIFSTCIQ